MSKRNERKDKKIYKYLKIVNNHATMTITVTTYIY